MIYQCKSLIKQFLEIHKLKIHSEEEFKKSYESYFRLFKVYKWKTFFNLERQDDWHGTLIIKKK